MDVDEYGFVADDRAGQSRCARPASLAAWGEVLEKRARGDAGARARLEELALGGVPQFLRRRVYAALVREDFEADYGALRGRECGYEYQIHADVQRTFRTHFLFRDTYGPGQCRLFHVLVAFANHVPAVGYCQGMSNIAGLLLMLFAEEDGFRMLASLVRRDGLETLFDKGLSKMGAVVECQGAVLRECVPDIYAHLQREGADLAMCAYAWYLTLFTRFDIRVALRVWDVFVVHGFPALFYVAASLLRYFGARLVALRGEGLARLLGDVERLEIDADALMRVVGELLRPADLGAHRRRLAQAAGRETGPKQGETGPNKQCTGNGR